MRMVSAISSLAGVALLALIVVVSMLVIFEGVLWSVSSLNIYDRTMSRGSGVFEQAQRADTYFTDFSETFSVEEASSIGKSKHNYWWVSSGGRFIARDGVGSTLMRDLSRTDRWYRAYQSSNPLDTDEGLHPQHIFRLVQRGTWTNFDQEVYARINEYRASASESRNVSNGILLFNRYQDQDNLYYAGVRVDGYAVIKKKIEGVYYTLGEKPILAGLLPYDREERANQLPLNTWIGIKTVVSTDGDAAVITLLTDIGKTGTWTTALEIRDEGKGGPPILEAGHGGIRTDFMDVQFDDYHIAEIAPE